MLQIMLCGAADTEDVRDQFVNVVAGMGAQPLHYLSGDVWYTNSLTANWSVNSKQTVLQADICVFVVLRRYGDITWSTELQAALEAGKPFIVLCLDSTYQRYLTLLHHISDLSAILDQGERHLVEVLRDIERERQLTIVSFSVATVADTLQRQLAGLFKSGMALVQLRNQRAALALTMVNPDKLRREDLQRLAELAGDELEDKGPRKRAIRVLARAGGLDEEELLPVVESAEQGVQRLAVQELPGLYRMRPPNPSFLRQLVEIANQADDVGVARRLIASLIEIDLRTGMQALLDLSLNEEGSRRRLAQALVGKEREICDGNMQEIAIKLSDYCLKGPTGQDWKQACRDFQERLRDK
ncbi:MAG: hypothetical protein M3256_01345 [Actinomycetota bacterium]|nr:hypothetical protein [Actinomycetota bacterium]